MHVHPEGQKNSNCIFLELNQIGYGRRKILYVKSTKARTMCVRMSYGACVFEIHLGPGPTLSEANSLVGDTSDPMSEAQAN